MLLQFYKLGDRFCPLFSNLSKQKHHFSSLEAIANYHMIHGPEFTSSGKKNNQFNHLSTVDEFANCVSQSDEVLHGQSIQGFIVDVITGYNDKFPKSWNSELVLHRPEETPGLI